MESRGASRLDCVSPRRAAPPNSIAYLCFRAAALLVRRIAACLAEQPVSARTLLSAIVEAGCSGKRAAIVWAAATARTLPVDDVLSSLRAGGFDPGVEGVPEATLNRFGLTRPFGGAAEADHIQLLGG